MFFSLVLKNSRKSRRENGIFFASLLISIIAFYIILSLENQDVMGFLATMESDAVNRLLQMIPLLYGMSLFLMFFLIYFASKYQLERRNHEFGIYLMMGMRRSRLFWMLLAEDIWSSLLSLAIGIPVAAGLSELISLITSKLVGIGIISHQSTFSWKGVILTVLGFALVKLLALIILSKRMVGSEISQLLEDKQEEKQREKSKRVYAVWLLAGTVFIGAAYGLAISQIAWSSVMGMGVTLILGVLGTFLFFGGASVIMELFMEKRTGRGLLAFTFRQIQENVLLRPKTLALSSLLTLMALCCFGYGVSVGWGNAAKEPHLMDFTFYDKEERITKTLGTKEMQGCIDTLFQVKMGTLYTNETGAGQEENGHNLQADGILEAIENLPDSKEKNTLQNNFQYFTSPTIISLEGYNRLLELQGKKPLVLKENQIALYNDPEMYGARLSETLEQVLEETPVIAIDEQDYTFLPTLCREPLVADRLITILHGVIVPDSLFDKLIEEENTEVYWNMKLKEEVVAEKGLMQTIYQVNELLKPSGLQYESYLQNMGRQLFFAVASSYITLYLAIIFLLISNTVLGVQFLTQQKKTAKRYCILAMLGSDYKAICRSARSQIRWYFGLPIGVAVVSSFFGIQSLFAGILPSALEDQTLSLIILAMAIILGLAVIEYLYINVVMRMSDRHILEIMDENRG